MKVFKPIRTSYLGRIVLQAGHPYLAIALLHYFPFGEPRRIGLEQQLWGEVMPLLGDQILDPCDPKPRAEVIVHGACHAPRGEAVRHSDTRLRFGQAIDKRIDVWGNRQWVRKRHGRLSATEPEPFTSMPLTWDHAFGGPGYPENPDGIGGWPEKPGGSHFPLPNLSYAGRSMRLPDDRLAPAALAPVPLMHPARQRLAGTYDETWARLHEPGYPRDIKPEFFLAAAPDQVLPGYFGGREPFRLDHMHPRHRHLSGRMPGLRARCFVVRRPPGVLGGDGGDTDQFIEVQVYPDTLLLFPEIERGILIHHGRVPLREVDGLDLSHLIAGFEWLEDRPRPPAYWQRALDTRRDPRTVARAVLETADLCPIGWIEPTLEPAATIKPLVPRDEAALPPRLTRLIEKVHASAAASRAEAGLPAATVLAGPTAAEELPEVKAVMEAIDKVKEMRPQSFAEAEAFREGMQAVADRIEALGRGRWADAEAQARSLAAEFGYDFDSLAAQAKAEAGAEPDVLASRIAMISERAREGLDPAVKAQVDAGMPQDLEGRFAAAMQDSAKIQAKVELEAAHLFPKPEMLAATRQVAKAKILAKALAAGDPVPDQVLTGMDLSGRKLDGIDFSGVNFTGSLFVGASLVGANLENAGLAHADLTRADLTGANLKGANLNGARLRQTIFARADLSGLMIKDVEGSQITFARANLTETRFSSCRIDRVSFVRADLTRASFDQCRFEQADLRSAKVEMTAFIFCQLNNADFRRIAGARLMLLNCDAAGALFRGAQVERLSVGGKTVLDGADLSAATLPGCNLSFASLLRARLQDSRLTGANLWMTDLRGADLSGADLRNAILMRADLADARLEGADLMQGNLMCANLSRTDFRGANLYGANTLKAVADSPVLHHANLCRTRLDTA